MKVSYNILGDNENKKGYSLRIALPNSALEIY